MIEATALTKDYGPKRAVSDLSFTVRPGVVQGRLEEMGILDLMQSLEMGQKSCQLTVRRGDELAELFFSSGQCKDAKLGKFEGEAAVYQAVRWPAGAFEIDFNVGPTRTTISRTTTGLLMEALRLMDEEQRDGSGHSAEVTEG